MGAAEITTIIVAVLGVAGVIVQRWVTRPHSRALVKLDLEILKDLPVDSNAKQALGKHIDDTIQRIIRVEGEERRDPAGITLALTLLALTGGLFFVGLDRGGAWLWLAVPAIFTGLFAVVGLVESSRKRFRDTTRRAIED